MVTSKGAVIIDARTSYIARLKERLQAAADRSDGTLLLDPEVLGIAFALRDSLPSYGSDIEALYALGMFHWRRSAVLGAAAGKPDRQAAVRYLAPCFVDGSQALPEELLAELADAAITEAAKRLHYARQSGDVSFISAAIQLWRRIARVTAEDHEDYLPRLLDLSVLLSERYYRTGTSADNDEAIEISRRIVELEPADPVHLINLSVDLCDRYERNRFRADIGEALVHAVRAVAATPLHHPQRQERLWKLRRAARLKHHRLLRPGKRSLLLLAVWYRVLRYLEEWNTEIILDDAALAQAFAVCAVAGNLTADLDLLGVVGWLFWLRAGKLGEIDGEEDLDLAHSFFRIIWRQEPMSVPAETRMAMERPKTPAQLERDDRLEVAACLISWHRRTGQVDALAAAIQVFRDTLPKLPRGPLRLSVMAMLSLCLKFWYEIREDDLVLDEAIKLLQDAIHAITEDDPARSSYLHHLDDLLALKQNSGAASEPSSASSVESGQTEPGTEPQAPDSGLWSLLGRSLAQLERYQATDDAAMLAGAIATVRQASEVARGGPDERTVITFLATNLKNWAERVGDPVALDEAISLMRGLVSASHDDEYVMMLALALKLRTEQAHDRAALDEAVTLLRHAADGPRRHKYLNILGCLLSMRYEEYGDIKAEDEALSVLREAVRVQDDEQCAALVNLGHVLAGQARRAGDLTMLNEGIHVLRRAVAVAADEGPPQAEVIFNLAGALEDKFYIAQDINALNEAIALMRDCVDALPRDDGDRPLWLGNLGNALLLFCDATGDQEASAEAVTVTREAFETTESKFGLSPFRLEGLGHALLNWYKQTGDAAALQESIIVLQKAADALPAHHAIMARCLSHLGLALWHSYRRSAAQQILEAAVGILQRAVEEARGEGPETALHLSNLGLILGELNENDPRHDPEAIIRLLSEAVRFTPAGHSARPTHLNNLAAALSKYHRRSGEAIRLLQQTIAELPEGHPARALLCRNLGSLLEAQGSFEEQGPYEEAAAAFRESALTAASPPADRIAAGRSWAEAAAAHGALEEAVTAMSHTIALLPQLAPRHLRRADSQLQLAALSGLANDAAAFAATVGMKEHAVQLLEGGRGILLARALELRGDEHALRELAPDLADRYIQLSEKLNKALDPASMTSPSAWRLGKDMRIADQEWMQLLEEIRSVPGLKEFQRPPRSDQLKAHAEAGPLVIINVSRFGSHAIIITADQIEALRLPGLTFERTSEQGRRFLEALDAIHSDLLTPRERIEHQGHLFDILEWLWDEMAEPVLYRIGFSGPSAPDVPSQHLWWCPTGPLAFLPLHAAGHHRSATGKRTVLDRVVSSYTPTVNALAHARRSVARYDKPLSEDRGCATSALVIGAQEGVTGPDAALEARKLASVLPHVEVVPWESASLARVTAALPGHRIAHFACHGVTDYSDPSENALVLGAYEERLTAAQISRLNLQDAELAFLSACDTTRTTSGLIDEAIHVTSAFQLAGYPHVIGTLCAVDDAAAAEIAIDVYERLHQGPAMALHQALLRAREKNEGAPSLWTTHVHVGP